MREYILSVTSAALLVSIARVIAGEGAMGKLVKLISGLFMAVTVLSPVVELELPDPAGWLEDHLEEGRAAAEAGEVMAKDYSEDIISAELEAYILDKAAALGGAVSAEVRLDESGLPETVTLSGVLTPAQKAELSRIIAEELGIGEEAQIWTD